MNVSSRSTTSIYYYSYARSTTPNGVFQSWRLQSDNSIRHKDFNPSQPTARVPYVQLQSNPPAAGGEAGTAFPKSFAELPGVHDELKRRIADVRRLNPEKSDGDVMKTALREVAHYCAVVRTDTTRTVLTGRGRQSTTTTAYRHASNRASAEASVGR